MKNNKNKLLSEVTEYLIIGLSMIAGGFGWSAFLLPHHITIGGLGGFASVLYWGTGVPIVYTYVAVNIVLMALALRTLGWRFCVRTIYAVLIFSTAVAIFQPIFEQHVLFAGQPFLACIVGGAFLGVTMGFALQYNASTGGSDVIAAIVHKYRDISLGRVILICDVCVITSSYIVLHSWESVIYGYIALVVISHMREISIPNGATLCAASLSSFINALHVILISSRTASITTFSSSHAACENPM